MAKKFNGHRCERRNLTDLVLGTGPDGKKRAKPKAKSRPKNFFKPGGPTGSGGEPRSAEQMAGYRTAMGLDYRAARMALDHPEFADMFNQMTPEELEMLKAKKAEITAQAQGLQGKGVGPALQMFSDLDLSFIKPLRERAGISKGDLTDWTMDTLGVEGAARKGAKAAAWLKTYASGGPSGGGGGGEADPPEEPGEGRRRLPQLYTGSPTGNVLDMLSNYDRTTYSLPEGMNPGQAIGQMALTGAYNQLPIEWLINNTGLPMDQAVMKYNAEQRAAQQPTTQQPTGGQPLDSIGGDLDYDYYEIDGEQVALPKGSPPPMGAAVVESAPQTNTGAPQTNVNTGTYNANTTFSGTPLQIGDNAAATASFGDARLAPESAGSGLATDLFNSMALMQHGVAPNTPATTSEVAFGAPYAAPGNYAMGPRNELADEPYDFMNFGAEQGMRNAFMPAGSSTTFDQDSPTGGVNMEAINRAVMRQPFGLQPSGLQGGLNSDLPDFKGMADAAKQKFDAFKATSGFGQKPEGDPSLMAQLGSQEGRANIVNQFLKPGGTGMKDLTQSTGMFANAAKGGVNMMTDKIASTMEGDDGFFAAGMGGAMRAGIGALMMGSPAALPIAAVGAIGGIVKRKREMDRANAMDNANNLKTVEAVQGDLADYNTQVNSVMNERGQGYRFGRYGGPMGQADYETEGGEMMMASPNDPPMAMGQGQYDHQVGNMYKVRGPSHEQGGVPTAGAMQPYIDEFGQRQDSPYVYSDAKEFRIDPTPFLKMLR